MLDLQEIEANAFARELLAPACVIKLKRYNSEEIKNNTLVSEENANIQYTQAHKRRKYTNTEKQLVKRFKGRYFKCVAALIAAVISIVVLSMSALSTRLSVSNKIIVQNQPLQIEIPSTLTQPQINFPNNENVYKAKTGRSYHNNTECRYIAGKNNVMTLTVEEAKNIGLTPCSVCY